MRDMRSLTVELPDELVRMVRNKVEAGEYASESELVRASLEAFRAQGDPSNDWLRTQALPVYDACLRDPARLIPAREVFARVKVRSHRP